MSSNSIEHMKFWGWGSEDKQFDSTHRPYFDLFIKELFGQRDLSQSSYKDIKSITLPESKITNFSQLKLNPESLVTNDHHERILHCYGKSYRDLFRARNGEFSNAPDLIIYPTTSSCILRLPV